jgi:hypothetical protein
MMPRRMLAAISVLALATVTTVAPLALFPGSAAAQNPDYILSLTDANGPAGGFVDVQVMFDNNGDDVQGWSLGVAHDPAFATLISVVDGSTTLTVNNGSPPDFNQVNVIPDTGFIVQVVLCFTGCAVLPSGSLNNELNIATYQLNAAGAGTSFQVEFVDWLGSPPVDTIVVVNGSTLFPATEDGTLSILDCTDTPAPPTNLTCVIDTTNNCQCQAQLEWQAPTSLIYSFEIYVDGLLATAVSSGATSAVIPLPTSDPSEICIRARCQDLFSPLVCCTVECDPDLDCNSNGVPDFCDVAQGTLDCNGNGQVDECEIASGSSPDCNNNGVPDFCDIAQGVLDCNGNGELDECEIASGSVPDCNSNGIIDDCEYSAAADCNGNGILDSCDLLYGVSEDCNLNAIPDECELDCDGNGIPDDCELITRDCNANGLIDICEIDAGTTPDCNQNGTPDSCEYSAATDCNANGILDPCDILVGISEDCDENQVPDECDIADGVPDDNGDGVPDSCEGDLFIRGECNGDDAINIGDGIFLLAFLFTGGLASTCQDASDVNDDGGIDIADAINLLAYLFTEGDFPPAPFPLCGPDPTDDLLGCESFGVCP